MFQFIKKREYFSKYRLLINRIFKVLCFFVIGIIIFITLQKIFIPKRFPYNISYDAGRLKYLYNEEDNTIDVLIYGTSHSGRGILPMEIYEKYRIKSYNMSTSAQPIEVTYFSLKEALKTQTPKVVILDVSSLFYNSQAYAEYQWKYVMDEMRNGDNKIHFISEYLNKRINMKDTRMSLLFPLIEYHTRWKELSSLDFNFGYNNHYYGKGGLVLSTSQEAISIEDMNIIANELLQNTNRIVYQYANGELNEIQEESVLYNVDIPISNIEWFQKIKELCDANNSQLLAIKIPTVGAPQWHSSAWSMERCNKIRSLCDEHNITYYDLLYDIDLGIDYKKDSQDGGIHLNLYGAQKASANLGKYLIDHYDLSQEHNDQWDRDLQSYQKVRKVALLELEQDFVTYINMLANEYKDNTIFITASDEMSLGLNEIDVNALRTLGLQMDYSIALQHSYIAVIEDGKVKYEALSNRPLNYSGFCENSGKRYELYSSGWWTGSSASIKLDGSEYAVNCRGLNIVVYDDKRGLVLDSVGFDTWAEYHTPVRNNGTINWLKEEFEHYIMEVEDR